MPDIGELVVGAWLTEVQHFDIVLYNRRPGQELPVEVAPTGLAGVGARLSELDVVGMNTADQRTYLAESTMHLDGMLIGRGTGDAEKKLRSKFRVAAAYADVLGHRLNFRSQLALWSPKVPKAIVKMQSALEGAVGQPVDFVVNEEYTDRVGQVIERAASETRVSGNDFYRSLQLLTHLSTPAMTLPGAVQRRAREVAKQLTHSSSQPTAVNWRFVNAVHRTQRGIYAPRNGTMASVICNTGKDAPYPDRFVGPDVLRYVGWGPTGDQSIVRDNESLRLAIEGGRSIRVFEKLAKDSYLDHGSWFGTGDPDFVLEPVTQRRLVVFVLRRVAGHHGLAS